MDKHPLLRKGLTVGIILLFVGITLSPGIYARSAQPKEKSNDEYQTFLKIRCSQEINQIFINNLKENDTVFSSVDLFAHTNQLMNSRCLDCILSEELKSHPLVTELVRIIKESPSLLQYVQQLSASNKICNLLLNSFFLAGWIAVTALEISRLLFPVWFIFVSIALLSIALFEILGCPYPPVP